MFADEVGEVHREFFGEAAPAATMVVVSGLLDPRWLVEIEAEAARRKSASVTNSGLAVRTC